MPEQGMKEYEHAIHSLYSYINYYIGMSRENFNRLAGNFLVRKFGRKTIILKPGEIDQHFNFILKGVARKFAMAGKKEITLQLSTEGHFIHSELSFFNQSPSDCFVEAIEPTVFLSVQFNVLENLYTEMPELNKLARLMMGEMYIKKELRDHAHLRLTTKERFLQYVHRHPDMLQRVSQKYIASYLNIKPETFSRLKHLLKKQ